MTQYRDPDWAEEELRAQGQRAPRNHFVYERYEVIDGCIRAVRPIRTKRLYWPMGAPSIVSELALIPPGDEAAALRFVKRWGQLGPISTGESIEWEWTHGDPLELVWAHANGVAAVLRLCKVPPADSGAITDYMNSLPGLKFGQGDRVRTWPNDQYGVTPMTVIGSILNPHLEGFHPQLQGFWGYYHLIFHWKSLINVVYRHLADIVIGASIKVCDGCGLPFTPTHGRQRFHPGSWNPQSKKRERSLCEQRYTKARRRRGGKKS